ncbi:MAG: glucans biosynthesis glucosyltransferase MdoH [Burkholderiaceae bacterium]
MELHRPTPVNTPAPGREDAPLAPPVHRTPMAARPWRGLSLLNWLFRAEPGPPDVDGPARGAGQRRRFVLLALSLAPAMYATYVMSGLLPQEASSLPEMALLAVFAILSCWLAAGFWTAMMGFVVLLRGGDRHLISRTAVEPGPLPAAARTAVVMPICNEDVKRVFAGLRATIESVARADALASFDFFILSDSNEPNTCVAELDAWNALRETLNDQLSIDVQLFYRRRERRVKRKSGNIDDFCRRWGALYRYMVVLDADSVMSGQCLATLVRLMEARPDAGIIQTAPCAVGRDTLHARIQQFANQVYGPLFTAGLHYWQLGESHYWGHNAIIRVEPFMKHCVLAPLPGRGALSGEIMSHDFVEAALMRRAGYGVWIAYDLPGSYEEMPSNLIEEVGRDRRWCHGNLMNARLMFAPGMHPVHRTVFLTGALAYLSAPLWAGFLALSTWLLVAHANAAPQYFVIPHQLFPLWPSWNPEDALGLFAAVASMLFVPKLLAALVAGVRDAQAFGGPLRLMASVVLEVVVSALLAPIRMLFHTQFVLAALAGWAIQWKSPKRDDASTSLPEAIERHGGQTAIGAVWVALVAWQAPEFLLWIAPVATGLLLAAPLSVLMSRTSLGIGARRAGLFMTPHETAPTLEVVATGQYGGMGRPQPRFADAVLDPELFLVVQRGARRCTRLAVAHRQERIERALLAGPEALTPAERLAVLGDRDALAALYRAVRSAPVHPSWTMVHGAASRATIHRVGERRVTPHGTLRTLAQPG